MERAQAMRVGVVVASFFASTCFLYAILTPYAEINAFYLSSGETVLLEEGVPINRYSAQLPAPVMQGLAALVFVAFAYAALTVVGASGVPVITRKLFLLFIILHIFSYLSLAAFHASYVLLLLSALMVYAQLYLAWRLRVATLQTLDFAQPKARVCLVAVDCMLGWLVYFFVVVILMAILDAQGIHVHTHADDADRNVTAFAVPRALVGAAKSSALVSVGVFVFYSIICVIFVNGSAVQVVNLVLCLLLLLQTESRDIVFFSLIVMVGILTLSIIYSGTLFAMRAQTSSKDWLDRYNEGVFADFRDDRLPLVASPPPLLPATAATHEAPAPLPQPPQPVMRPVFGVDPNPLVRAVPPTPPMVRGRQQAGGLLPAVPPDRHRLAPIVTQTATNPA